MLYKFNSKIIETTHDLLKDQQDDQIEETSFETMLFWMRATSTNVNKTKKKKKNIFIKKF